jgi:hypothetical protein
LLPQPSADSWLADQANGPRPSVKGRWSSERPGAAAGEVGAALLWTLEQGLGEAFTPEAREAWAAAYGLLATTMQDAARGAMLEQAA